MRRTILWVFALVAVLGVTLAVCQASPNGSAEMGRRKERRPEQPALPNIQFNWTGTVNPALPFRIVVVNENDETGAISGGVSVTMNNVASSGSFVGTLQSNGTINMTVSGGLTGIIQGALGGDTISGVAQLTVPAKLGKGGTPVSGGFTVSHR